MNTASDGTSTASFIAISVTIALLALIGIGIVLYKAAQHEAAKREQATKAQREEQSLQFFERLNKELNEDDKRSLARFALWLNGLYTPNFSDGLILAGGNKSLQLQAERTPSEPAMASNKAFIDLYSDIIGFSGQSVVYCYNFGYGDYNDLAQLNLADINDVIRRLAARTDFLALCVHHAATLANYLDYYYDPKFGFNNNDRHKLPLDEMLTQQTINKLAAIGKTTSVTYQTI